MDEDDIHYLQEKESHSEYVKKVPFKIEGKIKEKIHFIDVKDRKTGEWRSFQIVDDNWNWEGFHKISEDLENGKFSSKPSIDEFMEILKKAVTKP